MSPLKFINGQDLLPGKNGIVRILFDKPVVYYVTNLKETEPYSIVLPTNYV